MINPHKPSTSVFRRSRRHLLCLLILSPVGSAALAQVATEQPADGREKAPPQTMVRAFVIPAEGSEEALQMVVKPQEAADPQPQVLASTDGPAVFSSIYQGMAPGALVFELRAGDKVLATETRALRPARAYTLVAWQAPPSGWQVKTFADDPSSPEAADRALRLLNFPAGRETLFAIGEGAETRVRGNTVQEFQVPPRVVVASVKVLAPDGAPPALSTMEMDYHTAKSGYVVVVPDNLDRMRPQFIGGGFEEVVESAPAPTNAPAPVSPEELRKQRITGAQMEVNQQQTVLKMIALREAAMGTNATATLLENRRAAEKRLAELKKSLEEARSAAPPPAAP